jgi:hypothetical protein
MKRAKAIWILAFVVVFGSTSIVLLSSTGGEKNSADVSALKDRITQFWDCRLKGDYVTVYDLMSPDIRETVTRPSFVGAKGFVNYYSYDIKSIEIDGDEARARVHYTWKANHPLFEKSSVKDNVMEDVWVRIDGDWYKKFVAPSIVQQPNEPQRDYDDLD